MVVIDYRPFDQGEPVDKAFSATRSIALTGSHPDERFQPPTMSAGKETQQAPNNPGDS